MSEILLPPLSVAVEMEIPFHDVDTMHIVWHGHYLKYFEIARCKLLDEFDYNYPQMLDSGYMWPVIDVQIRYVHGIVFTQKICVVATLTEWENRLKIQYVVYDADSGKRMTKGHTTKWRYNWTNANCAWSAPQSSRKNYMRGLRFRPLY